MEDNKKTKEELLNELAALRQRINELEASESERKRSEEALIEHDKLLQAFVENSLDNVAVLNSDGTIRYHSPSLSHVLGYDQETQPAESALDFLHPDELPIAEKFLNQLSENYNFPVYYEFRAKHGDGTWHTVEVVLRSFLNDPIVGGILANFRDITERKLAEEARIRHAAALARTEELQRSRQRIVTVQESLRREISQQLHGTVQNRLIILLHKLKDLEQISSTNEMTEELKGVRQKLGELMEDHVRPISHRLYPSILRRGLVAALQSLGDQFESTLEIETDLDETIQRRERNDPRFIPEQVRLSAYRIAEEALTNAVKHAPGSQVAIRLNTIPEGWFHLVVEDAGQGFDFENSVSGLGTLMMQDYAEMVGGKCMIRSSHGKGTAIIATLPLQEPGAAPQAKMTPLE
jgi:PAS domain S-box-containing protein